VRRRYSDQTLWSMVSREGLSLKSLVLLANQVVAWWEVLIVKVDDDVMLLLVVSRGYSGWMGDCS
jgi:hypothetical protein